jgi:hypothetical protein
MIARTSGRVSPMRFFASSQIHTPGEGEYHAIRWGRRALVPVVEENGARTPLPREIFRLGGDQSPLLDGKPAHFQSSDRNGAAGSPAALNNRASGEFRHA